MSRSQRKVIAAIVIVGALLIGAFAALPFLARASNCGGNSAALNACHSIVVCMQLISAERSDGPVSVTSLTTSEREYFKQIAGLNWLPHSRVLVTTSTVGIASEHASNIVAVCDQPFDNVPRHFFGKAPLTHAVAYENGRTGLIPPEQFQRLDLSRFTDVRTIPEKKVEPNDSPNDDPPRAVGNSDGSGGGRHR
jgi:hypothetical protein